MRTISKGRVWVKRTVAAFATAAILTTGIMGYKEVGKDMKMAMTTDNYVDMRIALLNLSEAKYPETNALELYAYQWALCTIVKSTTKYERMVVWKDAFEKWKRDDNKSQLMGVMFGCYRIEDSEAVKQLVRLHPEIMHGLERDLAKIGDTKDERTTAYSNIMRILVGCFSSDFELRLKAVNEIEGETISKTKQWLKMAIRRLRVDNDDDIIIAGVLIARLERESEKTVELEKQLEKYGGGV